MWRSLQWYLYLVHTPQEHQSLTRSLSLSFCCISIICYYSPLSPIIKTLCILLTHSLTVFLFYKTRSQVGAARPGFSPLLSDTATAAAATIATITTTTTTTTVNADRYIYVLTIPYVPDHCRRADRSHTPHSGYH